MILSNVEIHKALDQKRLVITPEPTPRTPRPGAPKEYCPYDAHTVDLTLHSKIVVPSPGTYAYDLTQADPLSTFLSRTSKEYTIDEGRFFVLERHEFVLGMTRESVHLPIGHEINKRDNICLAARIEGKSSRARCGLLVHFTAPTIHPDWEGQLTLEMINLGPARILLRPGMPIAQLIIEEVKGIPFADVSQFQGQTSPEGKH